MSSEISSNINRYYLYRIFTSLELYVPVYVLFFFSNSLTMTEIMFLEVVYTALILLLEIPSGVLADRIGRKKTISSGIFIQSLGFIVFFRSELYIGFIAGEILWGIGHSLISGADEALLFDTLKTIGCESDYPKISGNSNTIRMFTLGLSTIAGGFIASVYGSRPLFLITAMFFFCGFLASLTFREPRYHKSIFAKGYVSHLAEAIRFSYTNRSVRFYILFFGIYDAFCYLLYYLIQPYFNIGSSPEMLIAVSMTAYFLFISAGSFFAKNIMDSVRDGHLVLLILSVSSISFAALYLSGTFVAILLVSLICFLSGIAIILSGNSINQLTGSHNRATVLSVRSMFNMLVFSIISPVFGYVTDTYSIRITFLLIGISLFIFSLTFLLLHLISVRLEQ